MAAAVTKAVIVPAWGQAAASNFYPWLKASLEAHGVVSVRVLDGAAPQPKAHLDAMRALCPEGPQRDTLYIGHSVGCQGILLFLTIFSMGRMRHHCGDILRSVTRILEPSFFAHRLLIAVHLMIFL